MSLGENISALRKKQGWSQEELALKLEVTRQSVSKWESDQSVPDIERIIAISRLFGVSTDVLLLDAPAASATAAPQLRRLTLADAEAYLQLRRRHAPQLARATFACITCAVPLMLLGAFTEWRGLPENIAGAGVILLLLLIAWAVSRYINCAGELRHLQYIEREEFIADAAVIALAEDTLLRENERITAGERRGTTCCILCPVPLLVAAFLQAGDVVLALCTCLLLVLVGIGVGQLIRAGELEEAAQALLQTAD
ncbi:MAG: helix-turn-helix transcriptional regulator, partial [Firmicutes bacterium]|nr:helix-turn-helix transcriptional regulator [Bacillota bacterium]